MAPSTKSSKGKAKVTHKCLRQQFIINASQPASDKIFDVSAFEKFLQDKIKVDGRVGNLGDIVQISQVGDGKIEQLRDWLRVVSTSKGVYELRFFNVVNDDAEEDDD
ncbi:ribosomal protein L22e [Diplocarpon rosae]|nr:ribosomal protein L22e [Diplocarpon rosae]